MYTERVLDVTRGRRSHFTNGHIEDIEEVLDGTRWIELKSRFVSSVSQQLEMINMPISTFLFFGIGIHQNRNVCFGIEMFVLVLDFECDAFGIW